MPQYNFDMSEYQESESVVYDSNWDSCADLSPAFFENGVSYFSEGKKLYLSVCATYEFETLYGLYCDLELPIPTAYQEDPAAEEAKEVEKVERWSKARQDIQEKFGSVFEVRTPPPLYPHSPSERKINAFSGAEISVPLGEGLLNFCYADFDFAFERCTPAYWEPAQNTAGVGILPTVCFLPSDGISGADRVLP